MKLECSVEKLKSAISQAERVTGKNLTLPILSSILMIASGKSLKLRATNLSLGIEVEIPAKVEIEGVAAIKGDVVSTLFAALYQNDQVSIELINDNLSVTTKYNHCLIKNYSHEDFPTIPIVTGQTFIMPAKKLSDGIRSVSYSSAVSDIKPEISSIYVFPDNDEMVFVATDAFRLAEKRVRMKKSEDFSGILIPFRNIAEIVRLLGDSDGDVSVTFTKNQLSLTFPGVYITSRIIDGIFPDYKQIMPKGHETEVIVLKQDLLNALRLSNVFSDKFNQITLIADPAQKILKIKSQNTDVGENETSVLASLKGEPVEINLNYKYFLDCFTSISSDSVVIHFNGVNKPMIVRGLSDNTFTYLVMPINR